MEIILHTLIVLELSWITNSFNVYEPARVPGWNYFGYSWMDQKPSFVFRKPMAAMVDLTNDLGVAILQDYSYSRSNFAFSPYGVASVLVVLYEGARGESARQIHRAVRFPWDKDITRIGFRDIHRHLRSYFSHEGYLSGITLSKDGSSLKSEYKRILRFYGYDVDVDTPERTSDSPPTTTGPPSLIPTINSTNPDSETTTTGGYDISTSKDPKETSIAPSTNNPEDVTAPSSDEIMITLTVMEDTESPVSPTTTITSSSTAGITELATDVPQGWGSETTEKQDMGNTEQSTLGKENQEDVQHNTEKMISEENDQHTQHDNENAMKGSEQDSERSTTDSNVQNVEQGDSEGTEQSTEGTESPVQQNSTQENGNPEFQHNSSETTEENAENTERNTEQDMERITQQNTETTDIELDDDSERITKVTLPITPTEDGSSAITDTVTVGYKSTTGDAEATVTTAEVEEIEISTPVNVVGERASLEEAEIAGNLTTEEGDRNSRSDALDNGMLIPQFTDGRLYFRNMLGLESNNPEKRNLIDTMDRLESSSEHWKEIGVALIAEGGEVKWEQKTLDEFLENLMREREIADGANRTRRLASGRRDSSHSTRDSAQEQLLLKGTRKSIGNSNGKRLPVDVETSAKLKRRRSTKEKRNISEFLKIPPITDLSLQLQNGMFDSHVSKDADLYRVLPKFLFLVDGAIDTPVPMMMYTNIFPFAYIPRLHCKALEFPLDDERYKLLILLPVERRGLRQLIYDLGSYSLREVMGVLRPARVKAMVPTFMVEGFVILTPTLQKMGIWDVFDPRRADLSGMTSDPDLYVRNIEQSVTVVIRNYVEILDIQTRTMAARHIDEDFTASHPFLYFVMDTATNVALMAGQMLDPLNSRIY